MKCSHKSTRFHLLFLSSVSMLSAALGRISYTILSRKSTVTMFGREVELGTPIERFGHERPFLKLIEVDELHYNVARGLTKIEMTRCVSALMSNSEPASTLEGAILLLIFTTDEDGSLATISLDKTHAFSILTSRGDLLQHHYFEKQSALVFQKVPSLSMALSGRLDLDDVRLLHFAGTGKHGLPSKSSIYEFSALDFRSRVWSRKKDDSLRISLLLDQDRNWGAPTLGLYGDEVYEFFLGAGNTGRYCGGNRDCPKGTDSLCGYGPAGPDKVCGGTHGGDILVNLSRALREQEIEPPVPIDFGLLRSLRKSFLASYAKGRDYVSYYHIAALFAKFDRDLLEKYVRALPHVDRAMRELLSGSAEGVIVTSPLRDSILDIVKSHRDVDDPTFQKILDIVEEDLTSVHGMPRKQVIDILRMEMSTPEK